MVRTRLLERIRITVNRIVANYVFSDSNASESEYLSDEVNTIIFKKIQLIMKNTFVCKF